jgi:hypothetical protein
VYENVGTLCVRWTAGDFVKWDNGLLRLRRHHFRE